MKRRQKAAFAVLKEIDKLLSRTARKNRGNDEEVAMIIATEIARFEQNTGMTVKNLLKAVLNENGHCPKEYRLIHIRPN